MQLEYKKTRISLTFPFVAVITLMLILCEEEIVLISVLSSLLHEAGHLAFMILFSVRPSAVYLGAFGIRIERDEECPVSYKREALIAMGGIMFNCMLSVLGVSVYLAKGFLWAAELFAVNTFVALFNMLPIKLLDFGRCLENLLMLKYGVAKCVRIMSVISLTAVATVTAACVLYNLSVGLNVSFIAVCVYIIFITTLKE